MSKTTIEWALATQWCAFLTRRDGMTAGAILAPQSKGWGAMAFETPGRFGAEALANHKHRMIGQFKTEDEAKDAGRVFLRRWARGKGTIAQTKCDCHVPVRRRRPVSRRSSTSGGKRLPT